MLEKRDIKSHQFVASKIVLVHFKPVIFQNQMILPVLVLDNRSCSISFERFTSSHTKIKKWKEWNKKVGLQSQLTPIELTHKSFLLFHFFLKRNSDRR
jgi:hypothetical protein